MQQGNGYQLVSIHTPTQGVTKFTQVMADLKRFQSTHPRRVWLCNVNFQVYAVQFQSTHPRRVWLQGTVPYDREIKFQSTHPRRVWRIVRVLLVLFVCFNPHTHAGCDLTSAGAWSYQSMFQSTHPRRVWHSSSAPDTGVQCFNPHTHAGCDCVISRHCQTMSVSIHTPTQGVTCVISRHCQTMSVSIHTPTQGVTHKIEFLISVLMFQSTHPRRVWQLMALWWLW